MLTLLTVITLVLTVVVVLVVASYLIAILYYLRRAGGGENSHLAKLAGGLEAIQANTAPLPADLTTIAGAMTQLRFGLRAVESHLGAIAIVLRR